MNGIRAALLGELESAVMDHLWSVGTADVKGTHRAVGRRRRITANTVQSTLERLHRKGLLDREKVRHAFVYAPRLTREAYGTFLVGEVTRNLMGNRTESLLAAFVDLAVRVGDERLDELERLIAERRAQEREES